LRLSLRFLGGLAQADGVSLDRADGVERDVLMLALRRRVALRQFDAVPLNLINRTHVLAVRANYFHMLTNFRLIDHCVITPLIANPMPVCDQGKRTSDSNWIAFKPFSIRIAVAMSGEST
jgi:hypothetical protein